MRSIPPASALSIAATYLADFKSAGSPPPHIVSRLEGTEIKLSTLLTAGHNGVAGGIRMQVLTDTKQRMPSSRVLEEVIHQVPAEYVTVGWLTSILHRHSFGIIILCLGLLSTTPIGSTIPGLVLAVMAVQLIMGRGEPVFPHFIMKRRLPTKQLVRLGEHAIYVLKYLEKAVHPRWPMPFAATRRAVGVMVLLLTAVLLLMPVPLSNVAPAMVISLIAVAYIEGDGLLLSLAFLGAIILVGIASAAVWGTIVGALFIGTLW